MSETLEYALELVRTGVLSIDAEGAIWRHGAIWPDGIRPCAARRAESVGGKGYLSLVLWIDGRARRVMAHRVVWTYFKGPIPDGLQINHKDSDKRNNRPGNLEPITGAGNIQHSYATGKRRHPWSDATTWRGKHRLTKEEVAEAIALRRAGVLLRKIAQRFGIGTTHAHRITTSQRD